MITLQRTHSENPDFPYLTNLLDDTLCALYNTRKEDYEDYNRISGLPTVVLAYDGDKAIGCGCFKITDQQSVEIKRMYVLPEYRGMGLAKRILTELELWAKCLGYDHALLETGKKQVEAIGFYKQMGYQPIEGYTEYDPLEISTCFGKVLSAN